MKADENSGRLFKLTDNIIYILFINVINNEFPNTGAEKGVISIRPNKAKNNIEFLFIKEFEALIFPIDLNTLKGLASKIYSVFLENNQNTINIIIRNIDNDVYSDNPIYKELIFDITTLVRQSNNKIIFKNNEERLICLEEGNNILNIRETLN